MFIRRRQLDGKVVAVTGGSRGIGRAIAAAMVAEGARVAIGARGLTEARRTAAELGRGVVALPLDVTDRGSTEAFLADSEATLGPVDILVNNAGIMHVAGFLDETDDAAVRQIDVNLHGVIHGLKAALPAMRRRRSGHVINVASAVARIGVPGVATYSAAKHGVLGLSEAVRGELRGEGIDISVVMAIPARTELTAGLPDARLVRWLAPEDIARAVVRVAQRPRFDVYVPRWVDPVNRLLSVVPRGVREGSARFLRSDQLLRATDFRVRAAYDSRAAGVQPATRS
jgi:NAD(P)-dependent dehydrogenase (short-subunit alcohol dehydrogenase family)